MRRVFIAIMPLQSLQIRMQSQIKKVEVSAKRMQWDINWTKPDNYHITLSFFGEISDEKIKKIFICCRNTANNMNSFDLKISGVGSFPNSKQARVIWLGVQAKIELMALHKKLHEELMNLEIIDNFENDYVPHLTIARLRNKRNVEDLISPLKNINIGKMTVNKLALFESKLVGKYPKYTELESFLFSNSSNGILDLKNGS